MLQTKISVVVPTYRRPELLQKCLCHLLDQTLQKELFEIIVVTDGPDNETREVVVEIATKTSINLRCLSLPYKRGPAAARNLGWRNANGILIAFTDDDCQPDKNWLQIIHSNYREEREIAFTGKVIVPVSTNPTDFELNTKGLETGDFVTANCVVSKTALERINGIDEAFTAAWREDSDLEFKLLKGNIPIQKLDEAIVVHPVRKAPWGVSVKEQKKTMFNALLYKKYPALFRKRIKSGPNWLYYLVVLSFTVLVVALLSKVKIVAITALLWWIGLTAHFAFKRISATRKTASHIFEMVITSLIIPFLSVFWTLYGAMKYRVLFF